MLRKFIRGLLFLLVGPASAFAIVFTGCEGSSPPLGTLCGHNIVLSLVAFTLASWFVLANEISLFHILRNKE